MSRKRTGTRTALVLLTCLAITGLTIGSFLAFTTRVPSSAASAPNFPPGNRFLRIRAVTGSSWNANPYTAQQVLSYISELQPTALERFTSGALNPNAKVPVCSSCSSMTVAQFLDASMRACNCPILPRVSLDEYDQGTIFNTAQELRNLPIYPQMEYLSLDNWGPFTATHTAAQIQGMFSQLYVQGWLGIGVNECGGYSTSYGYATFAEACVDTNNWTPNVNMVRSINAESNIKTVLMYIDFPGQMQKFITLSPTEQATVLTKLASEQSSDNYIMNYIIQQNFWDSRTVFTPNTSAWQGESIYTVQENLLNQYNPVDTTTTSSTSSHSSTSPTTTSSTTETSSSSSTHSTSHTTTTSSLNSTASSSTSSFSSSSSTSSTESTSSSSVTSSATTSSFSSSSSTSSTESTTSSSVTSSDTMSSSSSTSISTSTSASSTNTDSSSTTRSTRTSSTQSQTRTTSTELSSTYSQSTSTISQTTVESTSSVTSTLTSTLTTQAFPSSSQSQTKQSVLDASSEKVASTIGFSAFLGTFLLGAPVIVLYGLRQRRVAF